MKAADKAGGFEWIGFDLIGLCSENHQRIGLNDTAVVSKAYVPLSVNIAQIKCWGSGQIYYAQTSSF